MQEKLSNVGLGSIPRSITVCLDDDLADRCKPGDDVQIQGTVIRRWGQLGKVPFIYYVSTFIAQLSLTSKFFTKTGFIRQNKRISISTLHFDKIFMMQFKNFSTQRKMLKKFVKMLRLIKKKCLPNI